jgi:hypothetical protein
VLTFYGNSNRVPWDNPELPMFIGNELRKCFFVGFEMAGFTFGDTHIITAWGDGPDTDSNGLTSNPEQIKVADSDDELAGPGDDVRDYTYDRVDDHWHLSDYEVFGTQEYPYIMNVVTLSPPDTNCGPGALTVVGSYKIRQELPQDASDLHYKVGTDARICDYDTTIDWAGDDAPQVIKYHNNEYDEYLDVDWVFGTNGVPWLTEVTITTEFLLPYWNAIYYEDVYFTYDVSTSRLAGGTPGPSFGWKIDTADTGTPTDEYVVGAFEVSDSQGTTVLAEYRFQHEYATGQDPDCHLFHISSYDETEYYVNNLRFAASPELLTTQGLWAFEAWTQQGDDLLLPGDGSPVDVAVTFGVPCTVLYASSVRDHGLGVPLYLDLGTSGGIEPREGGVQELDLELDCYAAGAGEVTATCVNAGDVTARITGTWVDGPGLVVFFDPALPDQDACTISLGCGAEFCLRTCEGDADRSGTTTPADALATKIRFGYWVENYNCQWDFNCNGSISPADALQIKIRFAYTAPACPP